MAVLVLLRLRLRFRLLQRHRFLRGLLRRLLLSLVEFGIVSLRLSLPFCRAIRESVRVERGGGELLNRMVV